jgi:hypothetical protein
MAFRPSLRLPQSGPIKGLNGCPTAVQIANGVAGPAGSSWAQFDLDDDWSGSPTSINGQINYGLSIGCNAFRFIGNGGSGIWNGLYTLEQYLGRIARRIEYCESKGAMYYLTIGGQHEYQGWQTAPGGDGTITGFGAITSFMASVCAMAATYPNVIGADLHQEGTSLMIAGEGMDKANTVLTPTQYMALLTQTYAAVRAVAPNLALTTSDTQNLGLFNANCWTDARFTVYDSIKDFKDMHVYYNAGATDSKVGMATPNCVGKPLMVGEYGRPQGEGDSVRTAFQDNTRTNVLTMAYPSPTTCVGGFVWAAIPQDTIGGEDDWGLTNLDGTSRAAGTHYATFPGRRWSSAPFRRRRRSA